MKAVKTISGIIATMAGTQALLFWLGEIEKPIWFIAAIILFTVGLYCFADKSETEKTNR